MNHAVNEVLRHARIVGLPSVVGWSWRGCVARGTRDSLSGCVSRDRNDSACGRGREQEDVLLQWFVPSRDPRGVVQFKLVQIR